MECIAQSQQTNQADHISVLSEVLALSFSRPGVLFTSRNATYYCTTSECLVFDFQTICGSAHDTTCPTGSDYTLKTD